MSIPKMPLLSCLKSPKPLATSLDYTGDFELDDMSHEYLGSNIHPHCLHPRDNSLQGLYHPKLNTLNVVLGNKILHDIRGHRIVFKMQYVHRIDVISH